MNKGRPFDGKTPLSIASEKGHLKVKALIIQKLDVIVNRGWLIDSWSSIRYEGSSNSFHMEGGNTSDPEGPVPDDVTGSYKNVLKTPMIC